MPHHCPITGNPLPAGYFLHPSTREDFERAFARISIVFTALKEYQLGLTAPWETQVEPLGCTKDVGQSLIRENQRYGFNIET